MDQIKANITSSVIKANITTGGTIKVNVTSPITKATITQSVIKAYVKDQGPIGPIGPKGDQGNSGADGINVLYGTGEPPLASTVPDGTLYVQYTP